MIIRRLSPSNAAEYRRIRLRGLRECPAAFGSSYEDEAKRPMKAFRDRLQPTALSWTFGAFTRNRLAGVASLVREKHTKERHKAGVYGMYVTQAARGTGVGRALLTTVIGVADQLEGLRQVRLGVTETNQDALALYQAAGFRRYAREADALCVRGVFHAELFLVRRVGAAAGRRGTTPRAAGRSGRNP